MIRAGTKAMKRLNKGAPVKRDAGWLLPGLAGSVPAVWRAVSSPWVFTEDTRAGLQGRGGGWGGAWSHSEAGFRSVPCLRASALKQRTPGSEFRTQTCAR